jgi:hypothetical protein
VLKFLRAVWGLCKHLGPSGMARLLLLLLFGLVSLIPGMRVWLIKHVFIRGIPVARKTPERIDK